MIINTIWPVSGLGIEEPFDGVLVTEGEAVDMGLGSEDGTSESEKGGERVMGKSVDV